MTLAVMQHDQLPASVPTWAVFGLAAAAVGAWVLVHVWRRRRHAAGRTGGAVLTPLGFALRVAVGFVALGMVSQALQRVVVFATEWPIWALALGGALAVEAVILLYGLERRTVGRGAGLLLTGLRVGLILLIVLLLTKPERTLELQRTFRRYVAVLLDESASMHVADTQLSASEKLRLAEALGVDKARRPWRLEQTRAEVDRLRDDVAARVDYLASLDELRRNDRGRRLSERRETLTESLEKLRDAASEQVEALGAPLSAGVKIPAGLARELTEVRSALGAEVRDRLARAIDLLEPDEPVELAKNYEPLLEQLRSAAAAMAVLAPELSAAAEAADESYYESLSDDVRARVDAIAERTRADLARALLTRNEDGPSLLEQIGEAYEVRLFAFSRDLSELTSEQLADGASAETQPDDETPAAASGTNIAAALERLLTDDAKQRLAGVLMMTDGRHNAAGADIDTAATQLGKLRVPVCSAVLGAQRPPTDAAIVNLDAPETVYAKDRVGVAADLKFDGLRGKQVKVTLFDGDRSVDERTLTIPSDAFRTRLELADEPDAVGEHAYRVEVESFDGEVLAGNNAAEMTVRVTQDRTKMLLVDDRPRWEFRYLKNLFADRDKTVKLQYVLLAPDHVAGRGERKKVFASASRPMGQTEATDLPENEAEWLKFDVIVLGDVPPAALEKEDVEALHKFVTQRGGTLVVIAGPNYMPHAYHDTPLAHVLPVAFEKSEKAILRGPEPQYRLAITPQGRESVILRQSTDPQENARIWGSIPPLYWRTPITEAKSGATVLAYALGPNPPEYIEPPREDKDAADEPLPATTSAPAPQRDRNETIRLRRQFEREHALIARHSVALGQVLFLGFDRTWRLRYRVGDTYHHKFWGQVLRWATGNKLPAGTDYVKLGADRTRYAPDEHVRVRAKIVDREFAPLLSENVHVKLFNGPTLLTRARMEFLPDSPGIYSADFGALPPGRYRLELDAPDAAPILEPDHVDKISTVFAVESATPAEQVELAPDRGLLTRLADRTGGRCVDAAAAGELLDVLNEPERSRAQVRSYALWHQWPLLVLILAVATVEWVARKKVGLP